MIAQFYKPFQEKWKDFQTFWIFSDTHFGDEELRNGVSGRPSDEELLKRINSKVGKKDLIFILGDVGDIEFAKRIKGYKVLICGNHDVGHTAYEEVFDEVYQGALIVGEKIIFSHEPIVGIPWAINFHGHNHTGQRYIPGDNHYNVCADVVGYEPISLNLAMKMGLMSKIPSIHRITIDDATKRKKKRAGKPIRRAQIGIFDDCFGGLVEEY